MKIVPIASDSLGVRSLACYVETKDVKIFIDPSAALGPKRFGLPPSKKEFEALKYYKKEIHRIALKCNILIISHYHYDHYDPDETFYKGKIVLAKDRKKDINKSQKERETTFEKNVRDIVKELIYCDNQEFRFGKTRIKFSPPFYHGPEGSKLGFVLMTTIEEGKFRFLHAADVQGPISRRATEYIIKEKPNFLLIDSFPTVFLGWKIGLKELKASEENMVRIIEEVGCEVILDHHLLRDLRYKERIPKVYATGKVKTVAEFLGKENSLLEAHRKDLWKEEKK